MNRREFSTLIGGAARAAGRAHSAIGMLLAYAESDPETQARVDAFRQGLRELGWTEGHKAVSPASQPVGTAY